MKINLIVAHCKHYGIGNHNKLPWHYSCDMKWFRNLTSTKNETFKNPAVVMGKNTWFSLGEKPLPNRIHYVLSTTLTNDIAFRNIDDILADCKKKQVDVLWVIGGKQVYSSFIHKNIVDYQYITIIDEEYECDTFIDDFYTHPKWILVSSHREIEKNTTLQFNIYKNNE